MAAAETKEAFCARWTAVLKSQEAVQRRDDFWQPIVDCMWANQIEDLNDLKGATMKAMSGKESLKGGQSAFFVRMLEAANPPLPVPVAAAPSQATSADAIVQMLSALGTGTKAASHKARVVLQDELGKMSLQGLSANCWPTSELADDLKEDIEKAKSKGHPVPFSYVDISKRAMPQWAPALLHKEDGDDDVDDSDADKSSSLKGLAKALDSAKKSSKAMSMAQWTAGFIRYAICAVAAGQWCLASAVAHLDICLRVGEPPHWAHGRNGNLLRRGVKEEVVANGAVGISRV